MARKYQGPAVQREPGLLTLIVLYVVCAIYVATHPWKLVQHDRA